MVLEQVASGVWVSTVDLIVPDAFRRQFETCVFGSRIQVSDRYVTRVEAVAGHRRIADIVRATERGPVRGSHVNA